MNNAGQVYETSVGKSIDLRGIGLKILFVIYLFDYLLCVCVLVSVNADAMVPCGSDNKTPSRQFYSSTICVPGIKL